MRIITHPCADRTYRYTVEIPLEDVYAFPASFIQHLLATEDQSKPSDMLRQLYVMAEHLEGRETKARVRDGLNAARTAPSQAAAPSDYIDAEVVPPEPFKDILIHEGNTDAGPARPLIPFIPIPDDSLPPGTAEVRTLDGRLLGRIINIGDGDQG